MDTRKIYLVTYNKLFFLSNEELIDIAINCSNDFIKQMAIKIIINDDRLLDNTLDIDTLELLINSLSLDDLWSLASRNQEYVSSQIALGRLLPIIDDTLINRWKTDIYLIK